MYHVSPMILVSIEPYTKRSLVTSEMGFFNPIFNNTSFIVQKTFNFHPTHILNTILMKKIHLNAFDIDLKLLNTH